jgi:tRNA pseudouridine38-40 synthase
MRTFKLTLAYDGTAYSGWQWQDGQPTIQAAVEAAISSVSGQQARVTGSGRTDAGVHAAGQVAGFSVDTELADDVLGRALQANTPHDIYVLDCSEVSADFHPIRDAICKQYRYLIQDNNRHDVLARHYCWQIPYRLDVAAMQQAARQLIGTHDFACFEAAGSPRKDTIRTINRLSVTLDEQDGIRSILLEVSANGFLYNMVRNIVGSLVDIGRQSEAIEWLKQLLDSRDRSQAGPTAPAQGLTMTSVSYPDTILLQPPDTRSAGGDR